MTQKGWQNEDSGTKFGLKRRIQPTVMEEQTR